ncbi:hypothetical protein NDU88_002781 [Pleurodeles waltl]|uniref:Uncharacterized protein n=1 Tax=Pleurodeles waltl TaxID=8319 RepID=A0AAV7SFT4_PLEWA|nr:hypothetical protein NDU88_002781 [Pleurodeles waltl]
MHASSFEACHRSRGEGESTQLMEGRCVQAEGSPERKGERREEEKQERTEAWRKAVNLTLDQQRRTTGPRRRTGKAGKQATSLEGRCYTSYVSTCTDSLRG